MLIFGNFLMEHYLCAADTARHADHLRPYPMGVLAAPEMGKQLGEMDNALSHGAFLRCDALSCRNNLCVSRKIDACFTILSFSINCTGNS